MPIPLRPNWIEVSGGWFVMGGGPMANENPRHRVFVDTFRLAQVPVTRRVYGEFLSATGHVSPPCWDEPRFVEPTLPAVGVSWQDAAAFCDWLRSQIDEPVRLPTEAEWECAALGGRKGVLFPWGDDPPESLPDYGKRWQNGPEPVGRYPSLHPWGFHGLGENVHEWCADWYRADYYSTSPEHNPKGPDSSTRRSSRGGSWRHAIKVTRCAARSSIPPDRCYPDYGLRLACDVVRAH